MPKTMITIEKKELETKFNDEMLALANEVLSGYFDEDCTTGELESFDEYQKEEFNEAFEGTRKKTRNVYVGRAQALKSMINYFGVYVDKRGHQMLSVLIASDND